MDQQEIIESAQAPGWPGVYLLGIFDDRITFFSQQARGYNLAHALAQPERLKPDPIIAVIGAGAAGLAVASGLALLRPDAKIKVFEREQETLHLQRRCERRNLHPHIYDWPAISSAHKEAGLPYLNWSENSAAKVAETVGAQFDVLQALYRGRLELLTNSTVKTLNIHGGSYLMEYTEKRSAVLEPFTADVVILAIGFGEESALAGIQSASYWSDKGTPDNHKARVQETRYVVSGSGDGALVDLCAAALQNFDHTELIKTVTRAPGMDEVKDELRAIDAEAASIGGPFDFMRNYRRRLSGMPACISLVRELLPKVKNRGTLVFNTSQPECLKQPTSTLNRFMVFLVFQAAELAGRPISHVVGKLIQDPNHIGKYSAGGQPIEGDDFTIRHGPEKKATFAPFRDIFTVYEPAHKAWLARNPERSAPPKLSSVAESALHSAVQREKIIKTSGTNSLASADNGWFRFVEWSALAAAERPDFEDDETLCVNLATAGNVYITAVDAIVYLRQGLKQPNKIFRMLGLSGVGKTRLAEAVFDTTIEAETAFEVPVFYTDIRTQPNVSPIKLANHLIETRQLCVMVVDNCDSGQHQILASLAQGANSNFSLLTIDCDVEEDAPFNTELVRVEAMSSKVIAILLRLSFVGLPDQSVDRIAHLSGGNAKVALSLASAAGTKGLATSLSEKELFLKLLHQTNEPNEALEVSAQACALLHSFDGETIGQSDSHLKRLAKIVEIAPTVLYRDVSKLRHRQMLERRGNIHVFPLHAVANRLAKYALEYFSTELIEEQLVDAAPPDVTLSFARRLSYLADSSAAVKIAKKWLHPEGRLGDVRRFDYWMSLQFKAIAPLAQDDMLQALERLTVRRDKGSIVLLTQYSEVICRLASEPTRFYRCMDLLTFTAAHHPDKRLTEQISYFFALHLSGTSASPSDRLAYLRHLAKKPDERYRAVTLAALSEASKLTGIRFHSYSHIGLPPHYELPRPFGPAETDDWFEAVLEIHRTFMSRSAIDEADGRNLLVTQLWNLAKYAPTHLPQVCETIAIAARGKFWYEAWVTCNDLFEESTQNSRIETAAVLSSLRELLAPKDITGNIRAVLQGGETTLPREFSQEWQDAQRKHAVTLGQILARQPAKISATLPHLIEGGRYVQDIAAGLANDPTTWTSLLSAWKTAPAGKRLSSALEGFVTAVAKQDLDQANLLLDECAADSNLVPILLALQAAVGYDASSVSRLLTAFDKESIPHEQIFYLHNIFEQDLNVGAQLLSLLEAPIRTRAGLHGVINVTSNWLITFYPAHESAVPKAFLSLCRNILSTACTSWGVQQLDWQLGQIALVLFRTVDDPDFVFELTRQWRAALMERAVSEWDNQLYKEALLSASPQCVLNALYTGTEDENRAGLQLLANHILKDVPALAVVPVEVLIQWCQDGDAERFRYIAAAVPLLDPVKDGISSFTEVALALFEAAPDRGAIIETWTLRLQWHQGWSVLVYLKAAVVAIDSLQRTMASDLLYEMSLMRKKVGERVAELEAREQPGRDLGWTLE